MENGFLDKLGNKVKSTVSMLKSIPPSDNELESLKEKQGQINAVTSQPAPVEEHKGYSAIVPTAVERAKAAPYGSRPGETRYAIDKDGNLTPILSTPALAPKTEKKVTKAAPEKPQPKLQPIIPESLKQPMPVYDQGGDVDVNDGEHQVAILKDGERVLTPEETKQYEKDKSAAPVGFGGPIVPNPNNVKPHWDTEDTRASDTDRLPQGVKARIDNAPLKTPEGDTSNPPAADVKPEAMRVISARTPGVKTSEAKPEQTTEPSTTEEKPTLGQKLAENWLKKIGSFDVNSLQKPEALNTQPSQAGNAPSQAAGNASQSGTPQGTQSPLKPIVESGASKTSAPTLEGKAAYDAKIKDYDTQYQSLLDKAAKDNDPGAAEQAERVKLAKLEYQKAHPWGTPESEHPGILGKIGHVAEKIAARTPYVAPIVATAPQSELGMGAQREAARENIKEAATQKTARENADVKTNPAPKLLTGDYNTATEPNGTRWQRYEMPDRSARWAVEGTVPTLSSPTNPPNTAKVEGAGQAQAQPAPTIGNQPNIADNPAVLKSAQLPSGAVVGKPVQPKEGDQPASESQVTDVASRIKNNPYITPEMGKQLSFPEGYKPTVNDVKSRLSNIKEIEDAARQGKQDAALAALRKLQEENNNLLVKAHLADLEEKLKTAQAKDAMNASVTLAGLYAQENYKDTMDKWYESGNFAKDSGLVTEIVNKEHSDKGGFSGVAGDALVGSIFGPEGTAIGAGVGALTGMFSSTANGYLDTLKKQGISDEGYEAMQAYFNALPARMAYEVSVQGVSATALRSSQLIQKVLNTIPAPNTPEGSFDDAFEQYYKPMEILTKGKVELTKPKGYVPPTKEEIYPKKAATKPSGPEIPNAQKNKYHLAGAKGDIFSNDGKTWYDAQGKLIK